MGFCIWPKPSLSDGRDGNSKRSRQLFMRYGVAQIVGCFSEIHVCSPIDEAAAVNDVAYIVSEQVMNRTPLAGRTQIINCLVEGNSIHSTERMTDTHRDMIMRLLV